MKKISIGSDAVFYPGKREIISHNQTLKLHSSASYCFELLIARQGEIVDHESFYQYAWRRFGMEVSANALYQSISLVRKALLASGIRQDVIRTIPRRGFMLSNAILIEESTSVPVAAIPDNTPLSAEGLETVSTEDAGTPDLSQASGQDVPQHIPEPALQVDENMSEKPVTAALHNASGAAYNTGYPESAALAVGELPAQQAIYTRNLLMVVLTVMTIVMCGMAIVTFSLYRKEMDFVKRFDMNGCEIYGNEKADNSLVARIAIDIHSGCTERRKIYITAFTNGERISVLQCKNAISLFGSPDCVSYYYIRRKW